LVNNIFYDDVFFYFKIVVAEIPLNNSFGRVFNRRIMIAAVVFFFVVGYDGDDVFGGIFIQRFSLCLIDRH